jgi:hypothetical protein
MHGAQCRGISLEQLVSSPATIADIFSPHLTRLLQRLVADPVLEEAVRRILRDPGAPPDDDAFQRLRRMGVVARSPDGGCRMRVPLYETYLRQAWDIRSPT